VNARMDNLHIKRIIIKDLIDYIYIIRVDTGTVLYRFGTSELDRMMWVYLVQILCSVAC
jgi:hypothetical protein